MTTVQSEVGKGMSLVNFSSPFYSSSYCAGYCKLDTTAFNNVRSYGAIPFFSWGPGPGGTGFTDAAVAAGSQDSYVTSWAQAAKNWGHPILLRFAWEMNGSWFPWGVGNNGTTAADYVAMWRHVHSIFSSVGATNVAWVWCPNIDEYNQLAPMANLYPGDSYVDWTCLDGYNGNNPWQSFGTLFQSSYNTIVGIAPTKSMIIGETGSTESGGSKASWISNMLSTLPTAFPKVRGFLWFDKVESGPGGYTDWPFDTTSSSLAAFRSSIASNVYASNTFGNLNALPS
jgi:hypothetical protein